VTDQISVFKSTPNTSFFVEGDLISQNVAGNYSVVRCYIKAINGPGSSSGSQYNGFGYHDGHIDGITRFAHWEGNPFLPSGVPNGGLRWRHGPYDVRIDHNADGSHPPIRFAQVISYGNVQDTSFSGYMNLPTIARASTATFNGGASFEAGSAVGINTNRASGSFTHDITWSFGTLTGTVANGVGAGTSWTPPLSLLTQISTATSGTGAIRVITKSGSTVVGTTTTAFTLRAPASVVPTVTGISVVDNNPDVASIVEAFVQGLSRAKFTVAGAGVYGSTIKSSQVTYQGTAIPAGSDVLTTVAGAVPVTGRVTDSRGRTGSAPDTLNVLPYAPPAATAYQVRRCDAIGSVLDDGTHLRVDLTAAVSSLVNETERNALTIRAFTKPRGTTAWTARDVITPEGLTYNSWFLLSGGEAFLPTSSYDVRVQVQDKFGAYLADTVISTAAVALDLNGTKVGVGKVHERGTLDVAGDAYIAGEVRHRGDSLVEPVGIVTAYAGATAPTGWLLCDGSAVSRTIYAALFAAIGTAYGIGNGTSTFNLPDLRGRVPVGRDTGQTEFDVLGESGGEKTNTHNHWTANGGDPTSQFAAQTADLPRTRIRQTGRSNWAATSATGNVRETSTYNETVSILQPYLVLNHIIKAL
jgi:microcystin-dependent protein